MKKLTILLLLSAGLVFGQSAGKTGLSFLKVGFGARNIAMSDLGVTSANDLTALNYNPALISAAPKYQLFASHTQLFTDVNTEMFAASFEFWGLPFAVGLNTTSISDIEVRHKPGEAESTFDASFLYSSISTGFAVYNNIYTGITAKYLYEGIYADESNGYAFDFGLFAEDIYQGINLGASVKNIGSMDNLRDKPTKLPVDMRFGADYDFEVESLDSKVKLLTGIQQYSESNNLHIHAGVEIFYNELFAIRLGYFSGYETKNFSAGFGLQWSGLSFDYAHIPFDYDLGNTHTISLTYSF
jgi:hypothetical protein